MIKADISNLTVTDMAELLGKGEISSAELTETCIRKAETENPGLNAYLELFKDALEEAEKSDKERKSGKKLPSLAGIPIAVKDNILINGKIASSASKMLENYRASYDATVIKKLKEKGMIFLGRTNMDEFAMGGSTENSAFGPTKNPHDHQRVAGGSSGGSAAAVAAGLAPAALGSDTGGSIRQPAAFCGVVGLKPSYGRVSRSGLMAMASSLDQIGTITKTIRDAEIIFEAIKGVDENDSTTVEPEKVPAPDNSPKKIGVPRHFLEKGVDGEVLSNFDNSLNKLKELGYEIINITLPNIKYSLAVYYIIMPAEASTNLARYDGVRYGYHAEGKNLFEDYSLTRGKGFGTEVKRRIMLGTYALSAGYYDAYYGKASHLRNLIKSDFNEAFKQVDVIAIPTAPSPAWKIGEKTSNPLTMYLEDIFTVPANIAELPAISIPSGKTKDNLPLGLQLIGPYFREDILFSVGKKFYGH